MRAAFKIILTLVIIFGLWQVKLMIPQIYLQLVPQGPEPMQHVCVRYDSLGNCVQMGEAPMYTQTQAQYLIDTINLISTELFIAGLVIFIILLVVRKVRRIAKAKYRNNLD